MVLNLLFGLVFNLLGFAGVLIALLFIIDKIVSFSVLKKPVPKHENAAIFITGASSGIGRCIAESFAAKGFYVFGTVRKEEDAESLKETSQKLHPIRVDVRDAEKMEAAADEVKAELEKQGLNLISVIANAGVLQFDTEIDNFDLKRVQMVVDVNVTGVINTMKFFNGLLCPEGRIFVSGSYFGSYTANNFATYSGSKFFLEGYCDGVRKMLYNSNSTRAISLLKIGNIATKLNTKYGEAGPDIVFNGVWESLNSEYPAARIYSGSVGGIPCKLWCFIADYLPTALYDKMTKWVAGEPRH